MITCNLLDVRSTPGIVILVSSTFRTRTRRLVLLYFVVNGVALLAWMGVGASILATSEDGTIPGFGAGSPAEQVFWYGVGSTFFTTASFGLPVLVGAVLVVAAADWILDRSRSSRLRG